MSVEPRLEIRIDDAIFRRVFERMPSKMKEFKVDILRHFADFAVERMKLEAPQPGGGLSGGSTRAGVPFGTYSTGLLRDTIDKWPVQEGDGDGWTIQPTQPYTKYISLDTAPHFIRPSSRYFLQFRLRSGQIVRAKEVWHPGTKANPFIERTWSSVKSYIEHITPEKLKKAISEEI